MHRRCNVGDMLARWTNELFVSTPHRVLRPVRSRPPPPWVASRGACAGVCKRSQPTERVSVPYFYEPSYDAVIAPIDQLVRSSGAPEQQCTCVSSCASGHSVASSLYACAALGTHWTHACGFVRSFAVHWSALAKAFLRESFGRLAREAILRCYIPLSSQWLVP